MKTRNGFVSNSSSSSFVVLFPDDFNPDTFDYKAKFNELDKMLQHELESELNNPEEDIKSALKKLIEKRYLSEYSIKHTGFLVMREILKDYVLEDIDVPSGSGYYTLLNNKQIYKVLKIKKED